MVRIWFPAEGHVARFISRFHSMGGKRNPMPFPEAVEVLKMYYIGSSKSGACCT